MSKQDDWMTSAMRRNVIRETFEIVTAIEFSKYRDATQGLGKELAEDDRKAYFALAEQKQFADFQKSVENVSDNQLIDLRDEWIEKAGALGMTEWREAKQRASFEAMLGAYRGKGNVEYQEADDSFRPWPDLSPEAKLGYLARDAAIAGATPKHFAAAVREFLGDQAPDAMVALGLILESHRELHDVANLLPSDNGSDLLAPARPLAERLQEVLSDRAGQQPVKSLGREIAHDEQLRREAWELGEPVDRPTSPARSLADLKVASPKLSPSTEQSRSRSR
jgi:hypothetical protein